MFITWSESSLISQNWTVYKGGCYEQLAPLALSSLWPQFWWTPVILSSVNLYQMPLGFCYSNIKQRQFLERCQKEKVSVIVKALGWEGKNGFHLHQENKIKSNPRLLGFLRLSVLSLRRESE